MSRAAFALAALAVAVAPAAPALAQTVGVAAAVRNSVEIRTRGTARPLAVHASVAIADEVRTRPQSQAQLLLLDKSTFTVGANARVTIDRFVYDPARGVRSMGASVVRGAFRFMSGRPAGIGSTNSTIRTPAASIGIRGTMVEGIVGSDAVRIAERESAVGAVGGDPDTASLIILRGPGPKQQGNARPGVIDVTAGGQTLTLDQPMFAVYVPGRGRRPIGPFRITPQGLERVRFFLLPFPTASLSLANAATAGGDPGTGGPGAPGATGDQPGGRSGDLGGSGNGSVGSRSGGGGLHVGPWVAVAAILPAVVLIATTGKQRPVSP